MKCTGKEIIERLRKTYKRDPKEYVAYDVWINFKDPFKVLIATLLSQNSTDKGTYKAFYTLEEKIGVTPDNLIKSSLEDIASCIRNIGIYRIKAERIKELAKIIKEKYNGDLNKILDKEPKEAREELLSLPGIGEKTADVVLLTCKGYPYFPVDTHIKRISQRLGIASGSYEQISASLMRLFDPKDYLEAHHLLIAHGRNVCKAKNPLCEKCILNDCCEYYSRINKNKPDNNS
ncbi:DNA-(apurinic or apyrimidinic site) lyase [Acidianus hospitalis W1]|uniref:thymine-DNA glycosylase n=1 Tax=Acidianus hospitalis (strain W1) TaxID=933801 RepID=F4B6Q0_ACIHW|nr:endonuclease III [Acidianus hospitalis]AEE93460.1 DNA-(apurinic or apyrimidinic site) lyase [Acidianus hospitalis W1]